MGAKSSIEWVRSSDGSPGATWNPVTGCTKISPGCTYCYAERLAERFGRQKFTDIVLHPDRLDLPLEWRKPRRIFVNSMSDLFHETIPWNFLARVFATMIEARQHTFQVLTKRAERMRQGMRTEIPRMIHAACLLPSTMYCREAWPPKNVWLGVSAENQKTLDERWTVLAETPAAVRFLSLEPLLGPIDVSIATQSLDLGDEDRGSDWTQPVDWVIVGGESGGPPERALVERQHYGDAPDGLTHSRWRRKPEALEWVRAIRDQCQAAGVPFFFKQWGGPTPKSGGRVLDGRTWNEVPKC